MANDKPLTDEELDQIWENAPPSLPSSKELARAEARKLEMGLDHPHNKYPHIKPPQTRLQAIIGDLPLASQRKIVAAIRATMHEHNRDAVRFAIEQSKSQPKH